MLNESVKKVHTATAASELVRTIASVRQDGGWLWSLGKHLLRPLRPDEIIQLENQGNSADDWSRVRVADEFNWRKVRHCSFHGDVLLGRFTQKVRLAQGLELPAGIYNAALANCVIGHEALIHDVKLLANYVVGQHVVLLDCGTITCEAPTSFGNGILVPVGVEGGGREVPVYAEMDVDSAATVARSRADHDFLRHFAEAVAHYAAQVSSTRGVIGPGTVIRNTPTVRNTYLGPHARIDGATFVTESTVLSNSEEPAEIASGACVTGALLQWGSQVSTMAVVERSVLTEHSRAEHHAKITHSILGPNTAVAAGEVTCSLLGPFIAFHHQALLIAALWPQGKGNVSYGANVGANHTSKAPDQEFWPGEGAFLGLGVNIKFPTDFSGAPYTIVATGVTTLPQKLGFPFSVINMPGRQFADISPAYNEIIPAWLLTDSLYTLKRNEGKYLARNKARRTRFEFRIFRRDIVDLMRDACQRLESVGAVKEVYTDRDIDGLGKNYLMETHRRSAIEGYRFFTLYYALLELKRRVESIPADNRHCQIGALLSTPATDPEWEHPRRILSADFGMSDVVAALSDLPDMLEEIARNVERSKAKDDERGARIIDDYANAHIEAARDPFVRQTWEETRKLQGEVVALLQPLTPHHQNGIETNQPHLTGSKNG